VSQSFSTDAANKTKKATDVIVKIIEVIVKSQTTPKKRCPVRA
jgi:hypothetical protein